MPKLEMAITIIGGAVQMLVLGGGLLWGIAELKGDIRVIRNDIGYMQRDISALKREQQMTEWSGER